MRRLAAALSVVVMTATAVLLFVEPSELAAQVSPGKNVRVSLGDEGPTGDQGFEPDTPSGDPAISADGRYVVFESEDPLAAPDADGRPGDNIEETDIFRRDRDADEDGIFDEVGLDPVTGLPQTRTELVSVGVVQQQGVLACTTTPPTPPPPSVNFGQTQVGLFSLATVTCTSNGPGPVEVFSSFITGADAAEFSTTFAGDFCAGKMLLPTQTCQIQLQYSPDAPNAPTDPPTPDTATLNVPHDGANPTQQVALSGTPFANATLSCTPNAIDFGLSVGQNLGPLNETCTNNGPAGITVGTPSISGSPNFAVTSNTCSLLASGANCTIGITWTYGFGDFTGTLTVPHNGMDSGGQPLVPETATLHAVGSALTLRMPRSADETQRAGHPEVRCLIPCLSRSGKALTPPVPAAPASAALFVRAPAAAPAQAPPAQTVADEPSFTPVISGDGRLVAFESEANNLLVDHFQRDDITSQSDVFVRDMVTRTTFVISPEATSGETFLAAVPSISAGGSRLAFWRQVVPDPGCEFCEVESNLMLADISNLAAPVVTPLTESLDTNFDGDVDEDAFDPGPPSLSADGLHVATTVLGLADDMIAVFDVGSDHWERVDASVNPGGQLIGLPGTVNEPAFTPPAISGDGRLVAFTLATLAGVALPSQVVLVDRDVDGDGTFEFDPDLVDEWLQTISESNGQIGDGSSSAPSITSDGRYVAFSTGATNLSGDFVARNCNPLSVGPRQCNNVLVRDRFAPGTPLELASVAVFSAPANGDSVAPAIAASGRGVAFASDADNLIDQGLDTNTARDVYVRQFTPILRGAPDPLNFGTVLIGDSDTLSATFSYVGFGPLNPTSISFAGANAGDFTTVADTCVGVTLHQGQTCVVSVRYAPTAPGTRTATLRVAHDGSASPATIRLTGGAGPRIATFDSNPDELVFPEQVGLTTSAPQTVTITNTGNVAITINGVSIQGAEPGDYAIAGNTCAGITLAPGSTCTVSVTFRPSGPGSRGAVLRFDDTATGGPHLVGLRGTGATPTLIVNPSVVASGSVTAVTGTNWPANQPMTMRWADPVTARTTGFPEPIVQATANGAGGLTGVLVIFPNTTVGGRQLMGAAGAFTATVQVLVGQGSAQPGDFVLRR